MGVWVRSQACRSRTRRAMSRHSAWARTMPATEFSSAIAKAPSPSSSARAAYSSGVGGAGEEGEVGETGEFGKHGGMIFPFCSHVESCWNAVPRRAPARRYAQPPQGIFNARPAGGSALLFQCGMRKIRVDCGGADTPWCWQQRRNPMTKITALPTDIVRALQEGGPDAHGQVPERAVSDGGANPCRHCLTYIPEGKEMLILAHRPFPEAQPYAETGPIFLCADHCERHDGEAVPEALEGSPDYLIKGYSADHRIVYGTGIVIPQAEMMGGPRRFLRTVGSATSTSGHRATTAIRHGLTGSEGCPPNKRHQRCEGKQRQGTCRCHRCGPFAGIGFTDPATGKYHNCSSVLVSVLSGSVRPMNTFRWW